MHATYDRLPLAHSHATTSVSLCDCVRVILDQQFHFIQKKRLRQWKAHSTRFVPEMWVYLCERESAYYSSSYARSDFELVQMNLMTKIEKILIRNLWRNFQFVSIDRVNSNDQFERSQILVLFTSPLCFLSHFKHFPQHTCTHTHAHTLALLATKLICCYCCRRCMCLRMHNV